MRNIENKTQLQYLISAKHLARLLDIPADTLYKWRQLGRGPKAIKIGQRLIRYRMSDVEQYLNLLNIEESACHKQILSLRNRQGRG